MTCGQRGILQQPPAPHAGGRRRFSENATEKHQEGPCEFLLDSFSIEQSAHGPSLSASASLPAYRPSSAHVQAHTSQTHTSQAHACQGTWPTQAVPLVDAPFSAS